MPISVKPSSRAFTLMELIIVIIVMAMIMSITIPRLVSHGRRELQLAADQLLDMLTMFAQREATEQKPIALWHDANRNWIVLMVLDTDPADPEAPADWRVDPYVSPVKLPSSVDSQYVYATEDGEQVDFQKWPIMTQLGEPRLAIEISFANEDGLTKTVSLPAHALAPYRHDGPGRYADLRYPIDLDAAGRRQEDW